MAANADAIKIQGPDSGGNPLPVSGTFTSTVDFSGTATTPTQITKTVAASGTPEALAASTTYFRAATLIGNNAARTANTGNVFLGMGSGNDTQALLIQPSEVVTVQAPDGQKYDLNTFFLDVATNGDGLIIIFS